MTQPNFLRQEGAGSPATAAVTDRTGALDASRALLAGASLELSTSDRTAITRAAALVPPGTEVYVPQLPGRKHGEALAKIRLLHEAGLKPVPHIAARALASTAELEQFLRLATANSAVDRVLIIGGDAGTAAGPFADSASVLASGLLEEFGIQRVDVAGYPDGHPKIQAGTLRDDLLRKCELAAAAGFGLAVITQFSFDAGRIADYCAELSRVAPGIVVSPGLTGPTSAARLLHFARICGVAASIRAVGKLGLDAVRLVTSADPDMQLDALALRHASGRAGRLDGIHLFTFGGFAESADWLHGRRRI